MKQIIFDLDNTLINTFVIDSLRNQIKLEKDRQKKNILWRQLEEKLYECKPYQHIEELFNHIRENHINSIIVSNTANRIIKRLIDIYNIPVIDYIGRFTLNRFKPIVKPDPQPILKAVELLNTHPSNIISVGNESIDTIASNRANITSVHVKWGQQESDETIIHSNPTYIINDPLELIQLINQ